MQQGAIFAGEPNEPGHAIVNTAPNEITKAVILARGLGKRMRSPDSSADLADEQARAADAGMKAMIPIGRPFLDFVLAALADAGFTEVCLVVGPEHTAIREYYASIPARRVRICFAIQENPMGTANALLAAESFTAGESFLVLNSDNYYPVEVFQALRALGEPGLPAFEREGLLRESNIPSDRIRGYALLEISAKGYLKRIIEKPDEMPQAVASREIFISMNCWRFSPAIFRACREVPRSARGEFELPEAVQYGLASLGLRFKTIPFRAGVLDLSYRGDIAEVAKRLADVRVEL
ncbi:MAG TPA: nucleotidyltransferase family protein [Candidatus Acidoferrales bacterium]|nr:nucleotidyltransferase family protein [Candidatus Acidoferrales bacterium]